MKRVLAASLSAVLLLAATGCAYVAAQSQQAGDTYSLYFEERDLDKSGGSDAVKAESVSLNSTGSDPRQLAQALLAELLAGPSDDALKSPIPAGTQLLSVKLDGTRALVDLSSPYGTLSGISLTLADYCITLTLTQIPEIESVAVTVRGLQLAYRESQSFTADDVLLSSTEDVVSAVKAKLYFLDKDGKLAAEERTLELYEGDTQAQALLDALEEGPRNKELTSALPEGFSIQSAWMEDDVCCVSLPVTDTPPKTAALRTALAAVAHSLCSLDAVSQVRFLADGEPAKAYGGVDISQAFSG
jgi:Spore germination protein